MQSVLSSLSLFSLIPLEFFYFLSYFSFKVVHKVNIHCLHSCRIDSFLIHIHTIMNSENLSPVEITMNKTKEHDYINTKSFKENVSVVLFNFEHIKSNYNVIFQLQKVVSQQLMETKFTSPGMDAQNNHFP